MYPELFEIPVIHVTIKSYGLMMVVGFLAAVTVIRYLSRNITPDPRMITNAALYSLIAGVVGARLFYVLHYFDRFQDNPLSAFAIWQGGLELLGGVILAITIIFLYLLYHKLPIRYYLDILAIGLMLALAFGRIGCFLNGCCFGKPSNLPWAVRFPYNSFAYISQINANPRRNRAEPQLKLPRQEYQNYTDADGKWYPKPFRDLTEQQKIEVTKGVYRCLPVHPTQLYSSAKAVFLCLALYLFWRRTQNALKSKSKNKLFVKPGCTFALMFILYGIARFFMEFLRDDNPFEYSWWAIYKGGTISQNLGIYLAIFGIVLMVIFNRAKSKPVSL
jgi:phosphatidylglycerol:prolipoprotein diacylglycerol transferase